MMFKLVGMCDLLCKINLTRSLNAMRTLFPNEYEFYPKTWFLPSQREQFYENAQLIHKEDRKRRRLLTTFIVKPSGLSSSTIEQFTEYLPFLYLDGSEGTGIYLIQNPTDCNAINRPHVVQGIV
jgi:hypothetical protein